MFSKFAFRLASTMPPLEKGMRRTVPATLAEGEVGTLKFQEYNADPLTILKSEMNPGKFSDVECPEVPTRTLEPHVLRTQETVPE